MLKCLSLGFAVIGPAGVNCALHVISFAVICYYSIIDYK
jgi:hypothetical protein